RTHAVKASGSVTAAAALGCTRLTVPMSWPSARLTAIFCVPVSAFASLRPVSSSRLAVFSWSPMAAGRVERTATVRAVSFRRMCSCLGWGRPRFARGRPRVVRWSGGGAGEDRGHAAQVPGGGLRDGQAVGLLELRVEVVEPDPGGGGAELAFGGLCVGYGVGGRGGGLNDLGVHHSVVLPFGRSLLLADRDDLVQHVRCGTGLLGRLP